MTSPLVCMKHISIEFPGVKALDQVNFTLKKGTVHALIGANGAGKSTLMKVLSGAHSHYEGSIHINGLAASIQTPKNAASYGVQTVHQEVDTALVPYLSVGENMMMHQIEKKTFVGWKELHRKAAQLLKEMDIDISTKRLVSDLTLAEKQMVLIAKAVSIKCSILILDEPTAPLSHTETSKLFSMIDRLKQNGTGIVFISHRMPEIFTICDELTVMRNGTDVAKHLVQDTNPQQIIEEMLGAPLEEQFPLRTPLKDAPIVLEVKQLNDQHKLRNIHLHVKKGEILGIAGLVGAGKTELCKALFGASEKKTGTVQLHGQTIRITSPHQAVRAGMALVPEERRKEGVLTEESVGWNLTAASLRSFSRVFSFLHRSKEKREADVIVKRLGVKTPSLEAKVKHLSGGNQQKISIGKWLLAEADIYLFDEPTKGVDVGAKKDIFTLIAELADRGKSVIYASSELSEIAGIADRVYVLYDGSIAREMTAPTTEEELLYHSTGGQS
ncbi:sugar ABC transporter ATP-binding protein [Bacillus pumilus]|uniref:sugar ABC transporter ATP-binding protein n=1 Tax=Bacillus pumilus TaxID=1408 RepID=UPI0023DAD705|nr:sugar ABC transporter ATP-binding protein [Bacillus pumilus]MDF2004239.1 sugar ABC transporter ATP-binding protein [Bacillus pumilus]MDF2025282.1 sugar ABC transporter ATP-binding protein [Bacillus pumilus]MDF2029120.1 sugar ABC transporter ATP-binding protein [Bacillus pumilus]MDF2090167.1 sugar ABC transporter ATP-binding protein [Bacillus pumilus]